MAVGLQPAPRALHVNRFAVTITVRKGALYRIRWCETAGWCAGQGIGDGLLTMLCQHTSASLVASESYDPTARQDLEAFMDHLVLEDEPYYRHTLEGPDDSPSHMRAMLTHTSLSVPVDQGQLSLGTWQGLYLFEHRLRPHSRKVLIRCLSIA